MNFFHPTGYQIIKNPDLSELRKKYSDIWKSEEIPQRQLMITARQDSSLEKIPAIIDLIKFIRLTGIHRPAILEVGCSTGYHVDAFHRSKLAVRYEGCDYSPAFIKAARERHPKVEFKVSDATRLSYENSQFDIVISGCCILHIIDYQKAIEEAVRVAEEFVIFHRTPVIHLARTTFTKKIGYGLEMVEILFNEGELTGIFRKNNLSMELIKTHAQFEVPGLKEPIFMKNYLCRKCP